MGHRNFCCDGCQTQNFHGRRFHCLRCVNYDLCADCYDQHVETLDHHVGHAMQLIVDQERNQPLPEMMLNGEILELMHLSNCYTCPYCGIFGHTAKELIDHVVTIHRQADNHVVCPMCAGLPGIELVAIRNLARHLLLNHIEHANVLDPHTPPLRHALARVSRRRRRQQPTQNPSSQGGATNSRSSARTGTGTGTGTGNRTDSEAGIDILYQLSELRRLRPELRLSQTPTNYLEGDPRSRPATLAIAATESLVHGPVNNPAVEVGDTLPPLERSDADRFLLHQWMEEQHAELEAALRSSGERQQHTLFTEHLLLSMLCDEQLELPPDFDLDTDTLIPSPPLSQCQSLSGSQSQVLSIANDKVRNEGKAVKSSVFPCKYVPSHIMMLMSLPWIRPWSCHCKMHYTELHGVTLDESEVTSVEQQEVD